MQIIACRKDGIRIQYAHRTPTGKEKLKTVELASEFGNTRIAIIERFCRIFHWVKPEDVVYVDRFTETTETIH